MCCKSRAMRVLLLALTLLCAGLAPGCGSTGRTESPYVVPLYGEGREGVVKDQYFVIVKDETSEEKVDEIARQIRDGHGDVLHEYDPPVRGLAARLPPDVLTLLRRDAAIRYIEADQVMEPTGVQTCAPWNLDSIDQTSDTDNGVYAYSGSGEGVRVYVLDTGVDKNHPELVGRVGDGTCIVTGEPTCQPNDYAGHGTHVAGIIAGTHFGVAKKAKIVPVRVFPGGTCAPTGSAIDVADGLDWVLQQEQQEQNMQPLVKVVAVLGLGATGFGNLSAVSTIIGKINVLTASGIVVVVPAGNNNGDACNFVPGGQNVNNPNSAITVGAITKNGKLLGGSNWGACVDIFAPGEDVVSSFFGSCPGGQMGSNGIEKVLDGTSQAAAHVAGVAAIMLGEDPTLSPASLEYELKNNAIGQPDQNGSLGGVVRLVPNSGGSGDQDDDGCADWLSANASAPFCNKDGNNDICCAGIDESCGGLGIKCIDGNCSPCGAPPYACCNNDVCVEGTQCTGNVCELCGGPQEPCCGGTECATDLVCNGAGNCSCGNAGEPCCEDGGPQCYGTLKCGVDKPDLCGTCGGPTEVCCGGANGFCTTDGYTCSGVTCVECGKDGGPCCKNGDECFGMLECTAGTCQESCGAEGEPCCTQSQCDASLSCNAIGICACGNAGEPCCQNGSASCEGVLECDSSSKCAACGGEGDACCTQSTPSCDTGQACQGGVCTHCGNLENPCCENLPYCDASATCAAGVCSPSTSSTCWVRCSQGYLIYSDTTIDDGACLTWSESACNTAYPGSQPVRVSRSGDYLWDICEGNGGSPAVLTPTACGGVGEPCLLKNPRCPGASCKYQDAPAIVNGISQSSKQSCQ